jgi:uncharacterized protein YbaA (DUF1428 family)
VSPFNIGENAHGLCGWFHRSGSDKNLAAYRKIAAKAAKLWMEYDALEYYECADDDLDVPMCFSFNSLNNVKAKKGEAVVFSWIMYRSKAHRDAVNKKIMKDPRMDEMMKDTGPVFDAKRMAYGGFKVIVEGKKK